MSARLLSFAFLAAPALAAAATLSSVEVPRATPDQEAPSPASRACDIELGGRMPVVTDCSRSCYVEQWEGPLLWAGNQCPVDIWVTYVFESADGRSYRTPCFVLPPSTPAVVAEPAILPESRRHIHVAQEPGLGYPSKGFVIECAEDRTLVVDPPDWDEGR